MADCSEFCEFRAPIQIGDAAAVITVSAGSPDDVNDIFIFAEGCDCGYADLYEDSYCDTTEAGSVPNARVTDFGFEITRVPANHDLVIDAVERSVKLVGAGTDVQAGGLDVLSWAGVFEWIEAALGGCQRVCIDLTTAHTNADTRITVETYNRDL